MNFSSGTMAPLNSRSSSASGGGSSRSGARRLGTGGASPKAANTQPPARPRRKTAADKANPSSAPERKPVKKVAKKKALAANVLRGKVRAMMANSRSLGKPLTQSDASRKIFLACPNLHARYIREATAKASGKNAASTGRGKRPGSNWQRRWNAAINAFAADGVTRPDAIKHLARTEKTMHRKYLASINFGRMPAEMWARQFADVL